MKQKQKPKPIYQVLKFTICAKEVDFLPLSEKFIAYLRDLGYQVIAPETPSIFWIEVNNVRYNKAFLDLQVIRNDGVSWTEEEAKVFWWSWWRLLPDQVASHWEMSI